MNRIAFRVRDQPGQGEDGLSKLFVVATDRLHERQVLLDCLPGLPGVRDLTTVTTPDDPADIFVGHDAARVEQVLRDWLGATVVLLVPDSDVGVEAARGLRRGADIVLRVSDPALARVVLAIAERRCAAELQSQANDLSSGAQP